MVNLVVHSSDNDDKILDTLQQPYQMMLLPETYEQPPAEGFKFTQKLRVVPHAEELRVVVRDTSTGLAGSVDVPLLEVLPHEIEQQRLILFDRRQSPRFLRAALLSAAENRIVKI